MPDLDLKKQVKQVRIAGLRWSVELETSLRGAHRATRQSRADEPLSARDCFPAVTPAGRNDPAVLVANCVR